MCTMDVKIRDSSKLKITEFSNIDPFMIKSFEGVEPLRIGQIAPAAVHIKELNHIDPISADQVRNIDPLRVERFNVTHLPTVNLSLSRLPAVDLNVRRVPPVAIGVQQDFDLPSQYTVHARFLGVELMRLNIHGRTAVNPRDRFRREHTQRHERSFPDVAPVGNPAIPVKHIEKYVESVTRTVPCGRAPAACPKMSEWPRQGPGAWRQAVGRTGPARPDGAPPSDLNAGTPWFNYSFSAPGGDSSVSSGG